MKTACFYLTDQGGMIAEKTADITGVSSVAEGSAFVLSEKGCKISGKTKYSGVTMAAFRCVLPVFIMENSNE